MNASVQTLSLFDLLIAFIPALIAIAIMFKWSLNASNVLYAVARMLAQLMLIGYVLVYIFKSDSAMVVVLVLTIMAFASSWIALGSLTTKRSGLYRQALAAILVSGGATLLLVTQGVLHLDPWYLPQYMIPLAGMIFANAMNSVSLAGERLNAELQRDVPWLEARNIAMQTSLLPITNSLFAVGLVSLPGMMTGQILSGVSPFMAARYQIMVMCMLLGSGGIAAACFLMWARPVFEKSRE